MHTGEEVRRSVLDCSCCSPPSRAIARAKTLFTVIACDRRLSASCQLIPTTRQFAPTPCRLRECGLRCRFSGRYGSLLVVVGCVEALRDPVLRLWLVNAGASSARLTTLESGAVDGAILTAPFKVAKSYGFFRSCEFFESSGSVSKAKICNLSCLGGPGRSPSAIDVGKFFLPGATKGVD
jgi:hypothetical protein